MAGFARSLTGIGRAPAPAWRVTLAFLLAPLPSILLYAFCESGIGPRFWDGVYLVALLGAYPPLLLFGVPFYLLLRRRMPPALLPTCLLAGAVAALPWLLLSLAGGSGDSQVGAVIVTKDGRLTLAGLLLRIRMFAEIFAMGALAGAVFWAIASRRAPAAAQG